MNVQSSKVSSRHKQHAADSRYALTEGCVLNKREGYRWAFFDRTRTILRLYAVAVLAGIGLGAVLAPGTLRILCLSALTLALVRTAFLVSAPISALEIRYLDPLFPSLDMLAACVWCELPSRLRKLR